MDTNAFWKDDEAAHRDNCFAADSPQVALGIRMSEECVYAELGEDGDPWGEESPERRQDLNRRYNDKAEETVGIRLLPDDIRDKPKFPTPRRIGEVFGGTYRRRPGTGEWLHADIHGPAELEALLDRVEAMDLADFILPPEWRDETARIHDATGLRPPPLRHVRGPVTLATSLYGVENLVYLYFDAPDLFRRFAETIRFVILEIARLSDAEAGYTPENRPAGFSFADDDCALMTPEMYEIFGFSVLEGVFGEYSPSLGDSRFQHSDSDMGHLLPILGRLSLTGCNFGPNVLVKEIRNHMPSTRIDGCLAPFTFMSNDTEAIRNEVIRDCNDIRETGTKGLNLATAGSINSGSSLASMRTVMETIVEYGRY